MTNKATGQNESGDSLILVDHLFILPWWLSPPAWLMPLVLGSPRLLALRVMVVTPPIKHSFFPSQLNPDLLLLSTHRLPLGKALTILIHVDPEDGLDLVVWQAGIEYSGDVRIQVIHLL